jgi:hypothetical protein
MDVSEMLTRPEMVTDPVTSPDDYRGDTIADPDGASIRETSAEVSRYPFWALEIYQASGTNIFGKKFKDNAESLRPRDSYIEELVSRIEPALSENNLEGMIKLTDATYDSQLQTVISSVEALLNNDELSKEFKWNILIQPYSDMAHKLHAQRVIRKYTYERSLDKQENFPDGVLPEFLAKQQEKMLDVSALCGFYHRLTEEFRYLNGNKEFKPSVKTIEYQIKSETQSTAEYIASSYSQDQANKKTVSLDALTGWDIAC